MLKIIALSIFILKQRQSLENEAALNNLREGSLTLIKHSHTRRSRAIIHLVLKGTAHVGLLGHRLLHISVTFSMLSLDSRRCSCNIDESVFGHKCSAHTSSSKSKF